LELSFALLDADGDGVIDEAEMEASAADEAAPAEEAAATTEEAPAPQLSRVQLARERARKIQADKRKKLSQ